MMIPTTGDELLDMRGDYNDDFEEWLQGRSGSDDR